MLSLKVLFYTAILLWTVSLIVPYKVVDPEMAAYETEYLHYVNKHCTKDKYFSNPVQKHFKVDDLPANHVAVCTTNNTTKMHITYNRKYWEMDRHEARMITMFHELTHCYFYQDHIEDSEHFMYAYENHLPLDVVKLQLEAYLMEKCK